MDAPNGHQGKTKPALRKNQGQPSSSVAIHHHGIVWNEDNLAENEKIKASLPHVKINEPKTPFHELLPDDDVDLLPLALDGEAPTNGPDPAAVNGNGAAHGASDAGEAATKVDFANARKAHYNMKDILTHKKKFDDSDDEDEGPGVRK